MEAAIVSESMNDGVLAATLGKVAKEPALFSGELPAAAQWEIATDYRRDDEEPGTYCMDVWGDENVTCAYALQRPTESNIARAAEAASQRLGDLRQRGRPRNSANATRLSRPSTNCAASGR